MVRIVGGGFSGLTLAEALMQRKIPFEIYESSARLGGLLQTTVSKSGISEAAANGILWSPELEALCGRLNLKIQESRPEAKARWIYSEQKPRRWPLKMGASFKVLSWLAKYKLLPGSVKPRSNERLQDYGLRMFGREVTENLVRPAMHGIYGAKFEQLSATLILGKFFEPNRKKIRPRTVSFAGGIEELTAALAGRVSGAGMVRLNSKIKLTDFNLNSGPVVICTGLIQAQALLRDRYPDVIPTQPLFQGGLVSVTIFFESSKAALSGFGCLFSDLKETEGVMGVLFNSEIFEGRAQSSLRSETWILNYETCGALSDSEIMALVLRQRLNLAKADSSVREFKIWRWPEALPIYSCDLENWLLKIGPFGERALAGTPVRLHGNYMGEIGLSSILQRSQLLAEKLERMQ